MSVYGEYSSAGYFNVPRRSQSYESFTNVNKRSKINDFPITTASSLMNTNTSSTNSVVQASDKKVSLDDLERIEFFGHNCWNAKSLTPQQLCELLGNSVNLEFYAEGNERVIFEKLEGHTKAMVMAVIIQDYVGFWNTKSKFKLGCTAHVTTTNRALIPDGVMYYNPLRKLSAQQAAHGLMTGAPLPIWIAEVEFGHSVNKELMGYNKIRKHLMTMVGGNDESGQQTRIEEAWLIVIYQLQPDEKMLPFSPNVPQDAQRIVPTNVPPPLPTLEHPAYLVIFSRNPPGVRPTSQQLAPEQYYQLDPDTLFSPPPTSVARFNSPVYTSLANAYRLPEPASGPQLIPLPPNGTTPDISANVLLKSMSLMEEDEY